MTLKEDLNQFLRREHPKVINYLRKKYSISIEDAEDCFQEGCIAVWRNIHEGKLTADNLTSSLSTYLIGCCSNHASHLVRRSGVIITHDLLGGAPIPDPKDYDPGDLDKEEVMAVMQEVVTNMESPCREILWGTYYDKMPRDVIAKMTGLKNADTVKSQKVRCMKALKARMQSLFNKG